MKGKWFHFVVNVMVGVSATQSAGLGSITLLSQTVRFNKSVFTAFLLNVQH